MMIRRQTAILTLLAVLFFPAMLSAQAKIPGESIRQAAVGLSEVASSARRTWIEGRLEGSGITYKRRPWQTRRHKGTNLEVAFGPKKGPVTVLCAHFDVRANSAGANNNASGCAIILQLIHEIALLDKEQHKKRLLFVFLDGGELRHAGSRAFCEQHVADQMVGVYNFDLCGRGDQLVAGPGKKPFANGVTANLTAIAAEAKLELTVLPNTMAGEHRAFASFGIDAVTISCVPKKELDLFTRRFAKNDRQAPLPPVYRDAIRGRDKGTVLEASGLARAAALARAVLKQPAMPLTAGQPVIIGLRDQQMQLAELIDESAPLEDVRAKIAQIGFNGFIDFIRRTPVSKQDRRDALLKLVPRICGTKELRAAITRILGQEADTGAAVLARLKPRIHWDAAGRYYKLLP